MKDVIKLSYISYFRVYFVEACSFLFLMYIFFFNTVSSSLSVNYPCLMSGWSLIIFQIGLSVISGGYSSRFLKCAFHFRSLSSWLVSF